MKKYILSVLILMSILIMSSGIISADVTSPFSDDFENGDLAKWTIESGTPIVTNDLSYVMYGTWSALFDGTGANDRIATADIDTTGYKNITVQYVRRTSGLADANEDFLFRYSVDGGANYVTLETLSGTNIQENHTLTLPSSANDNPNVRIRFRIQGGDASDFAVLDNVVVRGDENSPPVIVDAYNVPTYPRTTTNPMRVCAQVTDASIISSVKLTCESSDHSFSNFNMAPSDGVYCADYYVNPSDAETMVCTVNATDKYQNSVVEVGVVNTTYDGLAPTADAGIDQTIDEGLTISVDGSGSSDTVSATGDMIYEWDWTSDGIYDDTGVGVISPVYNDDGVYTVTLRVTDEAGFTSTDTLSVTVNDLGPTAEAGADQTIDEGLTISVDGSGSTSNPDAIALYEWDWTSDGIYDDTGITATSPAYNDNGGYTVTLRVTDDDGSTSTDTLSVTVNNVNPVFSNLPASEEEAVVGEAYTFDVDATDAGSADTLTYNLPLGPSNMAINAVTGEITWTPNYTQRGDKVITVRVSDDDGGFSESTITIHVYTNQIDLASGWNLFSVPLIHLDDETSIGSILGDEISNNAEVIWAYQNGEWSYNTPVEGGWSEDEGRLQTLVPGYGYYIQMNDGSSFNYDGNKMYSDIEIPPMVTLIPGWNMIGHYGLNDVDKEFALTTLSGSYATLIDQDGNPILTLQSEKGYWLFVTGSEDVIYAPSDESYNF